MAFVSNTAQGFQAKGHDACNRSDSFNVPATLLESFIPGFGLLSRLFEAVTGFDSNNLATFAIIIAVVVGAGSYIRTGVRNFLFAWLASSVKIPSNDRLFEQIMYWQSQHELAKKSRFLEGKTSTRSADLAKISQIPTGATYDFAQMESSVPPEFTPAPGNHFFWFKGQLFFLSLTAQEQSGLLQLDWRGDQEQPQVFRIYCLGRTADPVKQFLMECKRFDAESTRSKTIVRRSTQGQSGRWQRSLERQSRPLDTVYMDDKLKTELLDDVKEFVHPQTKHFYARRGIPYRRGYLFHGPPGTGKTSMSLALAGAFGFELYVISLREPHMNEHKLTELFARLPAHCVVLLEDVDTAGLEKRANLEEAEGGSEHGSGTRKGLSQKAGEFLTLSGLLNAIDGVASHEGRILVMTTNDPETLDKALIRPGRVDKQVYFGPATKTNTYQIFFKMYASDDGKDDKDAALRVSGMAKHFSDSIPDQTFTPAEIQGFLLSRKKNPQQALDEVSSWRDTLLAARASGSNVIPTEAKTEPALEEVEKSSVRTETNAEAEASSTS